jgi:hypothetical protein
VIIALDLDGTLAHYDGWRGNDHIGDPVPEMVKKLHQFIADGHTVKLFTARVSGPADEARLADHTISAWLREHNLPALEITCIKHKYFKLFIDDRAIRVVKNTGRFE